MFHFSPCYAKILLFLSMLILLSSCGLIPVDSKIDELDDQAENVIPTNTEEESSSETEQNSSGPDVILSIPDPMADIQINPEIKRAYKNVAALNKNKKYHQAITVLEEIQVKYPQLSGPDYQKARIYFNQKKLDKALNSVEASLNNNARNYYALNLKGIILREQGQFEQSKLTYQAAIKVYPLYPNSYLNLGVLADIYTRELALALEQYKLYMQLVAEQDKKVANWIIELQRRIEAGQ